MTHAEAIRIDDARRDAAMRVHLCMADYAGLPRGMRDLYDAIGVIPTSQLADVALIRSHVAYWCGSAAADRAVIKPGRGHSYRITGHSGRPDLVRIKDHFDHRSGVVGMVAMETADSMF